MEIDFRQKMKNLDGTDAMASDTKEAITLMDLCVNSLLAADQRACQACGRSAEYVGGPEKQKRGDLARKIYSAKGPIKIDVEHIALIKKLIGEFYPPLFVEQSYKMLEQEKPEADKSAPAEK
jgi:hypothetical protein